MTPQPPKCTGPDPATGAFLGALAHEFGNTTYTLQLLVSVLDSPDTRAAALDDLPDSLKGLLASVSRLMNSLRRIGRIARGALQPKVKPLDAVAVIGNAVDAARPLLRQRRHHFEAHLPPAPLPLSADPDLLQDAVFHLLDNAARYTPPGGRVVLTAREDAGHLDLRVRDTGPGIDPGLLPHVFDLFRRGPGLAPDFANGHLGVGLALVRQVAEKHGGSAEVLSADPGQGSEFRLRIPLAARP